ncbi:hypothetical protein CL654_01050 [bacterium]|nr:hypothetical protein [bacterium]|tara:strand:+ start:524 stop:886 length:363 start_codon:yes stop_codon:yes gene_type:complete
MSLDLEFFKGELEKEQAKLEEELRAMGAKQNPNNPDDWEAVPDDVSQQTADKNEMADRLEDFEQARSTEVSLELRLNQVKSALKKIDDGTYGKCEEGGEDIPEERLRANPAATTCIDHAK